MNLPYIKVGTFKRLIHHLQAPPLLNAISSVAAFPQSSDGGNEGLHSLSKIHHKIHNHVKVKPTSWLRCAFTSCSTSQEISDLTIKKCVPCNSKDIRPMSEQSAKELLQQVQGWDLISDEDVMKLHRSWKVKSFTKGLEFFQLVAEIAEAEGHHPDLHLVGWNNVKIEIWTHAAGGLTENDYILAAKINSLNLEQLLRKKAAS